VVGLPPVANGLVVQASIGVMVHQQFGLRSRGSGYRSASACATR
jgi:hypothetical protein